MIFEDTAQNRINLEYATKHKNINVCRVTNIDISMQKKGSKFLCISGLKYYRENEPKIYKMIEEKYLTAKMHSRPIGEQLYYIAHNIRNEKTNAKNNPIHNRKRFEQRNYHKPVSYTHLDVYKRQPYTNGENETLLSPTKSVHGSITDGTK